MDFLESLKQVGFMEACDMNELVGFCATPVQQALLQAMADTYKKLIQAGPDSGAQRIPRILHQVWIGDDPIPDRLLRYQEKLHKLHPEWEYRLCTTLDGLEDLGPETQRFVESAPNVGILSDIMRMLMLHKHGGVYLDLDVELEKPLDDFAGYFDFLTSIAPEPLIFNCVCHRSEAVGVSNFLAGARPQHPILSSYFELVEERLKGPENWSELITPWDSGRHTDLQFIQSFQKTIYYTFFPWEEAVLAAGNRDGSRDMVLPPTFFCSVKHEGMPLIPRYKQAREQYLLSHGRPAPECFSRQSEAAYGFHRCSGSWIDRDPKELGVG